MSWIYCVRPVKSFPGYFVDRAGDVWSQRSRNGKPANTVRRMNPIRFRNRRRVNLFRAGKQVTKSVSSLVAEAFHGLRPEGLHCCHNDGDSLNDRADNLRWDTPKGNNADKLAHGTHQIGESAANVKLTEADVLAIREDGRTLEAIAADYAVTLHCIWRIKKRKTWKHI